MRPTSLPARARASLNARIGQVSADTKAAGKRLVSSRAWYAYLRATGYLPSPVDPTPLRRIASEDLANLADAEFLANDLLPSMGLTGTCPWLFPIALQPHLGHGTHHFQLPIQFGPFLAELSRQNVRTYLEIGVEHGGTFAITVEVLRRFGKLRTAVAVDIAPLPRLLAEYRKQRPEVEFVRMDSHSPQFRDLVCRRGPFDLVLIDADHTVAGCMRDLEVVRPHARMIAIHDINEPHLGVRAVWNTLPQDEYELHEYTAQYDELLPTVGPRFGIGLAIAKGERPVLPLRDTSGRGLGGTGALGKTGR